MLEGFRRIWMGWQGFARGILGVQNALLMGIAYFVGLGPVAIGFRLLGRRMLDNGPADPRASTYWIPRDGKPLTMEDASRPF
jgi:hypothetical protein